jgi:altronate dehydratase large subunit
MIANATGAMEFTHDGGCGQLGPDREHTERILHGIVTHPNVGGVLVVGLGCEQIDAKTLAEAAAGKLAHHINTQELGGNATTVEAGIEAVREMMAELEGTQRQPASIDGLVLATQCGSSDTGSGLASNPVVGVLADKLVEAGGTVLLGETGSLYGAAGVMAKRAISPEVGQRIIEITDVRERYYSRMGKSLKDANPTPGNIAGGLTTLVEKSLGGVRKGGTTPIRGVLAPGEQVSGKGLWVMDTSMGLGACGTADMLAGGAQVMAYTTGRGNPVGSPLGPVIKITATQNTVETLPDIVDFDASPVLYGEETVQECGMRLLDEFVAVANGKLTRAEESGHLVFAIGKMAV